MSAIEVLKKFTDEKNTLTSEGGLYIEFDEELNKYILSKTFRNALGEALLALEQKEKLEAIIKKFEISCGEDIYQSSGLEGKYCDIILEFCELIGYWDEEKERVSEQK